MITHSDTVIRIEPLRNEVAPSRAYLFIEIAESNYKSPHFKNEAETTRASEDN
jgi:hypothetical protein